MDAGLGVIAMAFVIYVLGLAMRDDWSRGFAMGAGTMAFLAGWAV